MVLGRYRILGYLDPMGEAHQFLLFRAISCASVSGDCCCAGAG